VKWTTVGGVLAALGVCAACCLLPFALLSIGVAGAWVSRVDSLAKYKWVFIALTVALLGYGFYAAYWRPRVLCAAGTACQVCGSSRTVRVGLWIATILAISGIIFEQLEPMLTGSR
jgi:mercuric ion transport protein